MTVSGVLCNLGTRAGRVADQRLHVCSDLDEVDPQQHAFLQIVVKAASNLFSFAGWRSCWGHLCS